MYVCIIARINNGLKNMILFHPVRCKFIKFLDTYMRIYVVCAYMHGMYVYYNTHACTYNTGSHAIR